MVSEWYVWISNRFDYEDGLGVGLVVITSISMVAVALLALFIFYYRKHNVPHHP
jgi:hypothetical protein